MSKEIDELISFVEEHCNRLTGFYGHYGVDDSAYTSLIKRTLNELISENKQIKISMPVLRSDNHELNTETDNLIKQVEVLEGKKMEILHKYRQLQNKVDELYKFMDLLEI